MQRETVGMTRRKVWSWVVLAAAVMGLSQCVGRDERVYFEGFYFRADAKHVDRDSRENFIVQVGGIEQSFEGALQAGEYEGIRYCVGNYGTSEINWISGPEDDPETLAIERGRLTFRGTCLF